MSAQRYRVQREDGVELGTFEIAELRGLWRVNRIDDRTKFCADGSEEWLPAAVLAGELERPGDDWSLPEIKPQSQSETGPAPELSSPQAEPPGLPWPTWIVLVCAVGVVFLTGVVIRVINPPPPPEVVAARMEREAKYKESAAQRQKMGQVGWELGRADGAAVGSQGLRKPSLNEIRMLCIKRAIERGVDKMDQSTIAAFGEEYQAGFQIAYKRTANW